MSVIVSYMSGFSTLRTASYVSKGFALHATPRIVEMLRRSDEDIHKAIIKWCGQETRAEAEEEYGHMSFWDTSMVTSMEALFKCL
ncbi:hypothetical protein TrLO_g15524 [Triparma laevis f. longispina]|uniref:Uncharacterized protein n=1 Tax=Triparma laevis f. longispina TaxID=1714387 RepID=A0A9W7FFH1_9STRA|nr:hypothetical protein TrLO_g15524 [Triparma laevis f. longispina]